jgi:hypothetical protein
MQFLEWKYRRIKMRSHHIPNCTCTGVLVAKPDATKMNYTKNHEQEQPTLIILAE